MVTKLTAQELCEYDDDQLGRYLEENGRIVKVADPQNLPQSFIQRLREWCDPEKQPGAAASQPVDMDQVNAKLMRAMGDAQPGFTPSPSPDTSVDYDERVENYAQMEEDAYDKLLEDGGQPVYDRSLIRAVCQEPYEHKDLLVPFTDPASNPSFNWYCALRIQWESWKRFRWTQKVKRKTETKLEAHNKLATENRIELGITDDFVFIMDTDKQDKLTTWMEYLQYECSVYIRHGYLMKHALKYKSSGPRIIKWVVEQIPTIMKDSVAGTSKTAADGNMVEAASKEPKGEPSRPRIPSPSFEDVIERNIEDGRRAYEELVAKGGRPLHPIEELRAIAEDPDAYSDLLLPFPNKRGSQDTEWWCKYGTQLVSWDKFRAHRDRARDSESRLDTFNRKSTMTRALIGVTRPVVFVMDTDKQDKLTNWMEYLQHECDDYERWYDSLKHYEKHRQRPILATINWIIEQIPVIEKEMLEEAGSNASPERANHELSQAVPSPSSTSASKKRQRDDDDDTAPIPEGSEHRELVSKRSRTAKASTAPTTSAALTEAQPAVPLPPPATSATAPQQAAPRRSARLAARAAHKLAETVVTEAKPPSRAKAKSNLHEKKPPRTRTKAKSEPKEKPTRSSRRQAVAKPQKKATAKSRKRG